MGNPPYTPDLAPSNFFFCARKSEGSCEVTIMITWRYCTTGFSGKNKGFIRRRLENTFPEVEEAVAQVHRGV